MKLNSKPKAPAAKTTNKLISKPGSARPAGSCDICTGSSKRGTAGEGHTTPKGWRGGRDRV